MLKHSTTAASVKRKPVPGGARYGSALCSRVNLRIKPSQVVIACSASLILFGFAPGGAWAAPISLGAGTYSQSFTHSDIDKNTSGSSSLPAGWALAETGTAANTLYVSDTGASATGNTYSYGASNNNDRAFGTLRDANLSSTIGATFTNNSGRVIAGLLISYTGEQWRLGATGRVDRLDFEYNTNASTITAVTGTWLDFNSLDFTAPKTTGTVGALDGNNAANRTAISNTISGLSLANGTTFGIRWQDFDATGSDDALGLDDFALTPQFNNNTSITAAASAAFGRRMLNQTPSLVVGLTKTGSDTTTYTAISSSTGMSVTADGSIAAGSVTENITVALVNNANGSASTGLKSYTFTIDNTAATSEATGLGSADVDDVINVSATVLSQRVVTVGSAVNFGNALLRGASVSGTVNLATTGDDDNRTRVNVAAITGADANGISVSSGAGTLFDDAADTGTRTLSGILSSYGTVSGSQSLGVTTAEAAGVGDTAAYASLTVNYSATGVGNATADKSNSMSSFGPALSAAVGSGQSYANLDSRVFSTTGSGGGSALSSVATILAGTNSSGTDTGVSMAWRTRTQNEISLGEGGSPAYPPLSTMDGLISDVVKLTGMVNDATSNPNQTDAFVLQMTYDELLIPGDEGALAALEKIYLARLDPNDSAPVGKWRNAIEGNVGSNTTNPALINFQGSYAASGAGLTLGAWGVDTAANTVWAVLDHNSQFAAVPEPSTLLLGFVGGIVLITAGRCARSTRSSVGTSRRNRS